MYVLTIVNESAGTTGRPKARDLPQPRVIGSCKPPDVDARKQTGFSGRTLHTLKH